MATMNLRSTTNSKRKHYSDSDPEDPIEDSEHEEVVVTPPKKKAASKPTKPAAKTLGPIVTDAGQQPAGKATAAAGGKAAQAKKTPAKQPAKKPQADAVPSATGALAASVSVPAVAGSTDSASAARRVQVLKAADGTVRLFDPATSLIFSPIADGTMTAGETSPAEAAADLGPIEVDTDDDVSGMSLRDILGKRADKPKIGKIDRESSTSADASRSVVLQLHDITQSLCDDFQEHDRVDGAIWQPALEIVSQCLFLAGNESEVVAARYLDEARREQEGARHKRFHINEARLMAARRAAGVFSSTSSRPRAAAQRRGGHTCAHCGENASHTTDRCWVLHKELKPAHKGFSRKPADKKRADTE